MDIFNRKKIEKLERELRVIKIENEDLRSSLYTAETHLQVLLEIKNSTPEDCTPGPYCKGCDFVKEYHYHNHAYGSYKSSVHYKTRIDGYICGRGNLCKNFVQRKVEE